MCVKLLYVKFVCVKLLFVCGRRRAAGGGGRGEARDTESKTRTPHKDAGKKCNIHYYIFIPPLEI